MRGRSCHALLLLLMMIQIMLLLLLLLMVGMLLLIVVMLLLIVTAVVAAVVTNHSFATYGQKLTCLERINAHSTSKLIPVRRQNKIRTH